MFFLLDEISRKLDWPLKDPLHNQMDKVDKLLKLRHGMQSTSNTALNIDNNKLTKQLSFYGITQFLYELIKLNKIMSHMYTNRVVFNLMINKHDTVDRVTCASDKTLTQLEYVLDLWSKLNEYKEVCNVITKCLTNCKLDATHIVQNFLFEFYYFYKFDLNKPHVKQYVHELIECAATRIETKKRIQLIAILFLEKSMYQV